MIRVERSVTKNDIVFSLRNLKDGARWLAGVIENNKKFDNGIKVI